MGRHSGSRRHRRDRVSRRKPPEESAYKTEPKIPGLDVPEGWHLEHGTTRERVWSHHGLLYEQRVQTRGQRLAVAPTYSLQADPSMQDVLSKYGQKVAAEYGELASLPYADLSDIEDLPAANGGTVKARILTIEVAYWPPPPWAETMDS